MVRQIAYGLISVFGVLFAVGSALGAGMMTDHSRPPRHRRPAAWASGRPLFSRLLRLLLPSLISHIRRRRTPTFFPASLGLHHRIAPYRVSRHQEFASAACR
jgi:hypothetical protein